MRSTIISLVVLMLAGALSFLSIGVLWAGVNQWLQLVVTFLFFGLSFFSARNQQNASATIIPILCGASPIGAILTMFRDKEGSHLLGISIVCSWAIATLAGAWVSSRSKHNRNARRVIS